MARGWLTAMFLHYAAAPGMPRRYSAHGRRVCENAMGVAAESLVRAVTSAPMLPYSYRQGNTTL